MHGVRKVLKLLHHSNNTIIRITVLGESGIEVSGLESIYNLKTACSINTCGA